MATRKNTRSSKKRKPAAKKRYRRHIRYRENPPPGARPIRQRIDVLPSGYERSSSGLVLPRSNATVKPSKLRDGLKDARRQIDETLDELIRTLTGDYTIQKIKLVASFNADGKFLGFGVGGAASVEITIAPTD